MKYLFSFVILLALTFKSQAQNTLSEGITTFYLIRHAEKDRSDSSNKNPHLTEKGHERAQHWSNILKHVKFDAIYSTDFHRTRETAMPIANSNQLEIMIYNPRQLDIQALKNVNKGKNVLIVGHSNTTPSLVNKLLDTHKYDDIDDDNNGQLFIVTMSESHTADVLLEINFQ
ncbi:phosphoglycerate mutase [Hanstruepera neustonica]|uniref:Phosphoglycerate mutase n=1 Tax=Hanstruepera neustonica TaxID=1445657 RepID=A0A2K1DXB1_9FLAO|nr:phosphoglycerate mutase family protein [Hanstruepera neustonica]PNQ72665.1 phosphoglycerate mutase [Hanstruepera neustonica]